MQAIHVESKKGTVTTLNGTHVIDAMSGVITTPSLSTGEGEAATTMTINNKYVSAQSIVLAQIVAYSGTLDTNGYPALFVSAISDGSFALTVANLDAAQDLSGTVTIQFVVINPATTKANYERETSFA